MDQIFNQWLAAHANVPGVLACGVRLPDGTCVSRSFNSAWPRERFDQTLQSLGDSLPTISVHGFSARWLTWAFEQGHLRVVLHPGGPMLGLAIQPSSPAADNLDLVTEEFLELGLEQNK